VEPLLFPLKPQGISTDNVESFASYFGRLAQVHGLSRAQLTRTLAAWKSINSGVQTVISETPVYSTSGAGLAGFGDRVKQLVDLTGEATGITDLDRLTLIKARPALARNCADTVITKRAWCEQCFREDLATSGIAYDRLTWTLWGFHRCPTHRLQLSCNCPHCGSDQPFHHRLGDPLLCFRCNSPLIGEPKEDQFAPNPSDAEASCLLLAAALARGELDELGDGNSLFRFEEKLGLIKGPVLSRSWTNGKPRRLSTRPSLRTYVSTCLECQVSIIDLLVHPEQTAIQAGRSFFASKSIVAEVRIRHPAEVLQQVREALSMELGAPRTQQVRPLRDLAGSLGVSEGYVRHHFSSEVKVYQSHRTTASAHLARNRERRAKECATEMLRVGRNQTHTLKELEAEIAELADCSIPVARRALAKAFSPRPQKQQRPGNRPPRVKRVRPPPKKRAWVRYDDDTRARIAKRVLEVEPLHYSRKAALEAVADMFDCGVNTLRYWVIEEELRQGRKLDNANDKKVLRLKKKLGIAKVSGRNLPAGAVTDPALLPRDRPTNGAPSH
jgi:hypothetical protein